MPDLQWVTPEIIKVPGSTWLGDIYAKLNGKELYVEPLSSKRTLASFMEEGGLGYGSLREGTFASKVFRAEFEDFEYGLDLIPLYNAGYPVHRIAEKAPHGICNVDLGGIRYVTLPVRTRREPKVVWRGAELSAFADIPGATNVVFVNEAAAQLLGLEGQGILSTYDPDCAAEGEAPEGVWGQRFFEDEIPGEHKVAKLLTLKTNVQEIHDQHRNLGGVFAAVLTSIGVLVIMSSESPDFDGVVQSVQEMRMTYKL